MPVDFSPTRDDYLIYRVPFAPALFQRLMMFDLGLPAQRVLDLGAGTGLFGAELSARGCNVIHVDVRPDLLSPGGVVARAEMLPFADYSFDIVSAAQCWHWFDRRRTPSEIFRVLRTNGTLAVIYQTYIPLPQSVAEATESLILRHSPNWRHANSTGINGQVLRDVQSAGFGGIESFSFDVEIEFTHETWRGFIRSTSPIGASMSAEQVQYFDREHEQMLRDWPRTLNIPHRVFAAIARKPDLRI